MTAQQDGPLRLTTARWFNRKAASAKRDHDGHPVERWSKVLAHTGHYDQFRYGTDTPSDQRRSDLQKCVINSIGTGTIGIDVDNEAEYMTTELSRYINRQHAISTRGGGFHCLVDARAVPEHLWPRQGEIRGVNGLHAADIKSNGFIPVPGSEHYSGERYEPVLHPGSPAGILKIVRGTPEIIAAIAAGQRVPSAVSGSGPGGTGGGHDGEVAAQVLGWVRQALNAGRDPADPAVREEIYAEWLTIAIPLDPAWPYDREDFERHYRTAVAKAAATPVDPPPPGFEAWVQDTAATVPAAQITKQADQAGPPAAASKQPNVTFQLLVLARDKYRFGITTTGEPFAVPKAGPNVARMLRGSRHSLRRELAALYMISSRGQTANAQALTSALEIIEAQCEREDPVELPLRVAQDGKRYALDLGTPDGKAVVISEHGWTVEDISPVLFRRTRQTMPLPVPVPGTGSLRPLAELLNVTANDLPLVFAVQVATLMPGVPHPVVLLDGDAGSAKTDAARILSSVLDPSGAQVRAIPRDPRSWAVAAASSYVIAIDNISDIPAWWSDAMCQAVTGAGWADRALWTDDDVAVLAFKRVIYLTSVDPGALREDFASRLIRIRLGAIPDAARRTEADITGAWATAHPVVLAGLLDLAVRVLAELPRVRMDGMPRMADFARVLAALDTVAGSAGLKRYAQAMDDLLSDVIDSDPVAVAVRDGITALWGGTTAQLLNHLMVPFLARSKNQAARYFPRDFPRSPQALSARLRRAEPALRKLGWTIEHAKGTHGRRTVSITPPPDFAVLSDLADFDSGGNLGDEDE